MQIFAKESLGSVLFNSDGWAIANLHIYFSDLIKRLQDMSENRRFLISEVEKTVMLPLLSPATNAKSERIFAALKGVKTYLRSILGNNQLHTLMLMHVHKIILDNINSAYVANEFLDRKNSHKKSIRTFFSELFIIHVRLS